MRRRLYQYDCSCAEGTIAGNTGVLLIQHHDTCSTLAMHQCGAVACSLHASCLLNCLTAEAALAGEALFTAPVRHAVLLVLQVYLCG
jgi:hypothetical protein